MDHATQAGSGTLPPGFPAAEPMADWTGKTLGDYRVLRQLGKGGMGQVYLAEQISLNRKVALKLLRPDLAADRTALLRFRAEALSVAKATHANIVQVYFISPENEEPHYMALEYVEGRNLREYLEKKGPPEVLISLSIMRQVAAALQRASELGIVHRDIKPENILVTKKGEVKVADFGLSRVFSDRGTPPSLTQSGVTMGTPLYMSPEQVEGKKTIDFRSDIYSFGVTSYHLLAGHPPFRGETAFEVAVQHVQNEPPPLAEFRPDLPPDLCALVHKMMAKNPEERPQTGREIVREVARLRDLLVGVSGGMGTPGFSSGFHLAGSAIGLGPIGAQPGDSASTQKVIRPPRSHRLVWLALGSILLALGGGLFAGWLRNRPNPAPEVAAKIVNPNPDNADPVLLREQELKKKFDEAGELKAAIDLGNFYVKGRAWTKGLPFFKELEKKDKEPALSTLGYLGHAVVLSYDDQAKASNLLLLTVLLGKKPGEPAPEDKPLKIQSVIKLIAGRTALQGLKDNPEIPAMIVNALAVAKADEPKHSCLNFMLLMLEHNKKTDRKPDPKAEELTLKKVMDKNPVLKVLLENPVLREMLGDALDRNRANLPNNLIFPRLLRELQKPWNPL